MDLDQMIKEIIRGIIQEELEKFQKGITKNNIDVSVTEDRLLSISDVAEKLKCTRQTVYNKHFKQGLKVLHPTDPRGYKKVRLSDLNKYLRKLENA